MTPGVRIGPAIDGRLQESAGGYIGFVEELPGTNIQGATIDEARANLRKAVSLVLEPNTMLACEDAVGSDSDSRTAQDYCVKRRDLIRHVEHQGCVLLRESANTRATSTP